MHICTINTTSISEVPKRTFAQIIMTMLIFLKVVFSNNIYELNVKILIYPILNRLCILILHCLRCYDSSPIILN